MEISKQKQQLSNQQRFFITYVRTKMFFKTKFRGIEGRQAVHIGQQEIGVRFFPFPIYNIKEELANLVTTGELALTEGKRREGGKVFYYEALKPGAIDISLLMPEQQNYNRLAHSMMANLQLVSLPKGAHSTLYFDVFLKHKAKYLQLFFTKDNFSGRVHTPITSFPSKFRQNILLETQPTCSIDVCTMQPLLLGKVLKTEIGNNDYSNWIDSGEDIYLKLKSIAGIESRDEAKKRFFEILFAPANNDLAAMFGNSKWISWINEYKSKHEFLNPHSSTKPHSNLAWLLQKTEVELMQKVWNDLSNADIPFLSVHDEIIVQTTNRPTALIIMREVLSKAFPFVKLSVTEQGETVSETHCALAAQLR